MQRGTPQTAELLTLQDDATGEQMGNSKEKDVVSRMSDDGPWDGSPEWSSPEAK
jgi:hypothetical protein